MDLSKLSTAELEKIASGNVKDLSTDTLKMIAGNHAKEPSVGHELLSIPHGIAKGLAKTVDLIDTVNPARIAREALGNMKTPSFESYLPSYEPETAAGRIAHKGAEYGSDMIGGIGIGKSLVKAGIKGAQKVAPKGASLIKRASTAIGNTLRNPAELFGNPQTFKEAAKMTGVGAGLGAGSGTLQEAGVNPLVADLTSASALLTKPIYQLLAQKRAYNKVLNSVEHQALRDLETKIGTENIDKVLKNLNKSKSSSIPGYEPTTAEVAKNTGLSQVQRAYESHSPLLGEAHEKGSQVLRSSLETLRPENTSIESLPSHFSNVKKGRESKARTDLEHAELAREDLIGDALESYNPEKTGTVLREGIEHQLKARERLRRQKSEPLYKALEEVKEPLQPQGTYDFIESTINDIGVKDPIKNDLLAIKKALSPNSLTPEKKKLLNEIESSNYSDNVKQQMKKEVGIEDLSISPTPNELNNVKKLTDRKISIAKKSGDYERAYYLSELKQNILNDLSVVPEAAAATKTYHQYSKPITEIKGDRALKKVIDQDIYKNAYKIGPAEIPKLFTDSTSSIRNAQNLVKTLRRDKETLNTLKEHIYQDFVKNATNSKGDINIGAIQGWMKSHPGASVIDPHFGKKLNTLAQAQRSIDHARGQLKNFDKIHDTEAFKNVLGINGRGVDSDKIVKNILGGDNRINKTKEILEIVKTDKSGRALEGLRHGVIEDVLKRSSLSSVNASDTHNLSYHALNKYLASNGKALKMILSDSQMKTLRDIEGILKNRTQVQTVGKGTGSDTTAKLNIVNTVNKHAEKGLIKSLLGSLRLGHGTAQAVLDTAKAIKNNKQLKLVNNKKEFMDQFLASPKNAKEALTRFKSIDGKLPKFSISPTRKSAVALLGRQSIQ